MYLAAAGTPVNYHFYYDEESSSKVQNALPRLSLIAKSTSGCSATADKR